ncbi:MAG: hypothetical protein WCJ11_01165 [Methylococcaceae bacterium]
MKITFFIGDERHFWNSHHEVYVVRENQVVYFELANVESYEPPTLFIEDNELNLTVDYRSDAGKIFRSAPDYIFRESFGHSTINVYFGEQHIELRFEVVVRKVTAQQVEEMIQYLAKKQDDILRICLSRTLSNAQEKTDPEIILNTVETFVNTLISCRLELQHHLRKRLVPIRQSAWKSSQGSDIDPFDIIFNLDALEPVLGEGDVVVNGRSFSISEMEVTTLEPSANVEENAILLGGLYAMSRIITVLLLEVNSGFSNSKTELVDSEFETLSNVLQRLTASNMQQRCERQLFQLDEFIRYFEKKIGVIYKGERPPVMTPFVRASRIYRRLFEQLHDWYQLGEPTLDGRNYLVKLRSVSKIYEFVALFKLIDYLHDTNWLTVNSDWAADSHFVPSKIIFERDGLRLTLHYEKKIYPYSEETTKHLDLVDTKHFKVDWEYNYWCPDFVLKLESSNRTKALYVILDAKNSSSGTVQQIHLPNLVNKYFMNMAIYDATHQHLKQDAILGIIALFPDKHSTAPTYLLNGRKFGVDKKPIRFPIVTGLPMLPQSNDLTYQTLNQIFEIAEKQLTID